MQYIVGSLEFQYITVVKLKSAPIALFFSRLRRSVAEVRPVGIAAVLCNVQVDQDFFHSFIDIQVIIRFEPLNEMLLQMISTFVSYVSTRIFLGCSISNFLSDTYYSNRRSFTRIWDANACSYRSARTISKLSSRPSSTRAVHQRRSASALSTATHRWSPMRCSPRIWYTLHPHSPTYYACLSSMNSAIIQSIDS